jgi:hypothetical protein
LDDGPRQRLTLEPQTPKNHENKNKAGQGAGGSRQMNDMKKQTEKQNHYLVLTGSPDGSANEIRLEASDWQTAARLCVPAYTGDSAEPFRVVEYIPAADPENDWMVESWEFDSDFVAKLNKEVR